MSTPIKIISCYANRGGKGAKEGLLMQKAEKGWLKKLFPAFDDYLP